MIKTMEYYFKDGSHVKFKKYTIDTLGTVRNNNSGKILRTSKSGKYNVCSVQDVSGKQRMIRVCRALASTFLGPPTTTEHTADHKDGNSDNDNIYNIRWLDETGQKKNRTMPDTLRSAFIIVKGEDEKTAKEWVDHLKGETNSFGRGYTVNMILKYARHKQFGFSYKEYQNLSDEVWKEITGSKTTRGHWEISNMNRVKYVTNFAENVLEGDRIGLTNDYPRIVLGYCHILSFMTFFPHKWSNKKLDEMVLHEDDNRLDFRPHKLRLGTHSENTKDAHDNGKYGGTKIV